ncbi:LCP family protein [Oribacterium sp. WCC10]|uniref:LCP family protein n=1 Tax=Oribacterium sp. WCC10 TaxID=1855343 RepID=UPI0008E6D308|nr:LCP family protein [Oribacterium sp. WCC10]SFG48083.1 cell envelope-related function transcriptional attenuator common domain-containing protein [Oribacterium sp. WCC10]
MRNTYGDESSRRPRRTARSRGSEERLEEIRSRSERRRQPHELYDDSIDIPLHNHQRAAGTGRQANVSGRRNIDTGYIRNDVYGSRAVSNNLANLEREAAENELRYGLDSDTSFAPIIKDSGSRRPDRSKASRFQKVSSAGRTHQKSPKRFIATLLICALILVGGFFAWSQIKNLMKPKYWTVAVFGVDSRDGNLGAGALSDVIMVASINRRTGDVNLTSVYRDTYLQIDDDGNYHKINEAYFKGGYEQAIAALERNLQLEIDDYVTFNWKAVAEGITMLGGVDLDISDSEFKYINAFITETVNSTGLGSVQLEHSGMNHLDGVQAVAYGRLRLMDTDFNRTARQRKVLQLAIEKAKTADKKTLAATAMTVMSDVKTSIGLDDILDMAKNVRNYNIQNAVGFPFSRDTTHVGKMDVVVPATLASNVVQLHPFLYGDDAAGFTLNDTVSKISAHIQEKTGIGELKNADIPKIGGGTGVTRAAETEAANAAAKETAKSSAETNASKETTEAETRLSEKEEDTTAETIEENKTTEEETEEETKESTEEKETSEETEKTPESNASEDSGNTGNNVGPSPEGPGNSGNSDNSGFPEGPVTAGPGGLPAGDTEGPSGGPGAA